MLLKQVTRCFFILFFFQYSSTVIAQDSLSSFIQKAAVAGVQLSIVKQGKEQQYCYGYAHAENKKAVTNATVFQAASLSKPVLAYIALRLHDKQLLSLDTPLIRYYNYSRIAADRAAQKITARMVLRHSSGLPNWAANPLSKQWQQTPLKTGFEPGTGWRYSGEGFMFLQLAIQQILQQSLEQIAISEVFSPLQMKSSSFIWQPAFDSLGAYGHNKQKEPTERAEFFLPAGAYSLLTTAHDYQLFVQALIKGTGLSVVTHQLLLQNKMPVKKSIDSTDAASHISWSLGVGRQQNELGSLLWHWGDNGDFKCFFMADPATGTSVVCMTNSANGLELMKPVFKSAFGRATWWAVRWLHTAF